MLLAAGLGTRLRPLTKALPKSVVPVANRPLGAYALDVLARGGVREVVANTHWLPEIAEERLAAAAPKGLDLAFAREQELLGTGGGIANVASFLFERADDAFVVNADALVDSDLTGALARHRAARAIATMIVVEPTDPALAVVHVDGDARVRAIGPDPVPGTRAYTFVGTHVLSARGAPDYPASGCIIRSSYATWLMRGEPVAAFVHQGRASSFRDLGTLGEYLRGNADVAAQARGAGWYDAWRAVLVGDGASIQGAQIDRSVLGRGVRVASGVRVTDSVVWDDATVATDVTNAVVMSDGTVVPLAV